VGGAVHDWTDGPAGEAGMGPGVPRKEDGRRKGGVRDGYLKETKADRRGYILRDCKKPKKGKNQKRKKPKKEKNRTFLIETEFFS